MRKNAMSNGSVPDPNRISRRLDFVESVHMSGFFKRVTPGWAINWLRALKIWVLMRDFQHCAEFEQSMEDALASASLSIVVPIHDAPAVTRRCLVSLEKYAPKAEIIIVDDASQLVETSGIIDDFASRNMWKLVHHEKPHGHSAACGAGASLATRPYLCLLNSDTVVTPWCWRLVTTAFQYDQTIGVAGPSSSLGNLQTLPLAKYLRFQLNNNQICEFAKRLLRDVSEPIVEDVAWASGFAFFIRRSLWEQLGGLDKNLPDYGNEVELCKRVAAKGYRRAWVRNAYIHHFGQQTYSETIGEDAILARIRTAEIYIAQKHHSTNQ
jgi:GT2 family glycosyltransferase